MNTGFFGADRLVLARRRSSDQGYTDPKPPLAVPEPPLWRIHSCGRAAVRDDPATCPKARKADGGQTVRPLLTQIPEIPAN